MEERRTNPNLLMLIIAVGDYIRARQESVNPLVKGFGQTESSQEAYDFMVECFEECAEFFPETHEFYNEIQALIDNSPPEESGTHIE
jgi:hypothetical protein